MQSLATPTQPLELMPGAAFGGGFFVWRFVLDGQLRALIVAPKAEGDHEYMEWIDDERSVPAALSYDDGLANTTAMAEAGSALALWARDLRIAGHDDWYLPSQDELELMYRYLKPTKRSNYCWVRSGINLSAAVPTRPYTPADPAQTVAAAFQHGGAEAFEPALYWSSTQHAASSNFAWYQHFDDGNQNCLSKSCEFRARAVRRVTIQ